MEQSFEQLKLNKSLVETLKLAEITVPTEIQQLVIPVAQQNGDLIFQSETGTGKTLAYLLPLFEKIETDKKEMQAIILVPTHELAIQVIRVIEMLSLNSDIKATSTPIIGDVNITRQVDKLRTKPHIIVGTAGRILELIQKKKISAHTMKTIIIDEADRLLDDNNIEGVKAVIKTTLKERQLMMCSASMSARTIERARQLMKEPQVIKSKTAIEVPDTIDHLYFVAEQRDKIEVLRKLVRIINPPKAIAFFANADDILEATEKLKYHKLRADGLHGSNIKADRKKAMDDFKSGRLQLLIASDIAARGLDIEGVTHIFNVNIPERSMDYLHRAGRTGRNGNRGMAISIVNENEIPFIKQFEKELRISITPKSMYNGVIAEYRKERQKLDTTSEYDQRRKNKDSDAGTEADGNQEGSKPVSKYKKDSRTESGHKPPKYRRDSSGDARFARDKDRPAYKHDRDDRPAKREDNRPAKRFDNDNRPERKYKQHDTERPASYKKEDRPGDRFKDGKKSSFGGTKFKIGGKPDGKFSRDEKPGTRFKKDSDKSGFRFDRDKNDRPGKKFGRDNDSRPDKKFDRDKNDRPGKKFGRDNDSRPDKKFDRDKDGRPDKKFGRDKDSRPDNKFGRDKDGRPDKKFGRDDRSEKRYDKDNRSSDKKYSRDNRKEGGFSKDWKNNRENSDRKDGKPDKIQFVGKPPKNLKPWERKPQSGPKKGK